ncbi:MAG TPA: hypothetical protein EYQ81_03775 [Sneathiellales bacterium]|nr:hypothetical protein [Sneathiellales bacterium]
MALPQDVSPLNSELMDTLFRTDHEDWIPQENDPERAFMKVLFTGSESGVWVCKFRWLKGYTAPQHKHLSSSHTFILSGKLQVRDGTLNAGDYVYEPDGMLHGETKAMEDTEYLFICTGPVIFYDDDKFTGYINWETLRQAKETYYAQKEAAE